MTELATAPRPQAVVDDTNHDLVHALSVRLDARWQEGSYGLETHCAGCRQVFDRLREIPFSLGTNASLRLCLLLFLE